MFPLPLTWSKQLIPHPNTLNKKKKETPFKMCINYPLSCRFLLSSATFHPLNIRPCKTSSGSISSYNMKHTMKNTKTCWQMLLAQNSAPNKHANGWKVAQARGVMFHKLKQTDYTSLLAKCLECCAAFRTRE
jgi:hypothetical protein